MIDSHTVVTLFFSMRIRKNDLVSKIRDWQRDSMLHCYELWLLFRGEHNRHAVVFSKSSPAHDSIVSLLLTRLVDFRVLCCLLNVRGMIVYNRVMLARMHANSTKTIPQLGVVKKFRVTFPQHDQIWSILFFKKFGSDWQCSFFVSKRFFCWPAVNSSDFGSNYLKNTDFPEISGSIII